MGDQEPELFSFSTEVDDEDHVDVPAAPTTATAREVPPHDGDDDDDAEAMLDALLSKVDGPDRAYLEAQRRTTPVPDPVDRDGADEDDADDVAWMAVIETSEDDAPGSATHAADDVDDDLDDDTPVWTLDAPGTPAAPVPGQSMADRAQVTTPADAPRSAPVDDDDHPVRGSMIRSTFGDEDDDLLDGPFRFDVDGPDEPVDRPRRPVAARPDEHEPEPEPEDEHGDAWSSDTWVVGGDADDDAISAWTPGEGSAAATHWPADDPFAVTGATGDDDPEDDGPLTFPVGGPPQDDPVDAPEDDPPRVAAPRDDRGTSHDLDGLDDLDDLDAMIERLDALDDRTPATADVPDADDPSAPEADRDEDDDEPSAGTVDTNNFVAGSGRRRRFFRR